MKQVTAALVLATGLAGMVCATTAAQDRGTRGRRTVYVSALDDRNAPVADLTRADLTVQEDGRAREIIAVEPAKTPLHVALMADDSGLALAPIREGLGAFIERLQNKAAMSIITTGGRNLTLVDYTTNALTLYEGVKKISARNTEGSYLIDGLIDTSQALARRGAARPVIVAIVLESEELSSAGADRALDAIQATGVAVNIISIGTAGVIGMRPLSSFNDASVDGSSRRNAVIASAPERTGGLFAQLPAASGIPTTMRMLAGELATQYAVVYADAMTTTGKGVKLEIETTRGGVKLRAPTRVVNK